MKFINLYKKFQKSRSPHTSEDNFYNKLSFEEIIEFERLHQSIEFNESESNSIKKIISNRFSICRIKIAKKFGSGLKFEVYPIVGEIIINITKFDDDWFCLSITNNSLTDNYLCDQLEGVIQCIKNYKK